MSESDSLQLGEDLERALYEMSSTNDSDPPTPIEPQPEVHSQYWWLKEGTASVPQEEGSNWLKKQVADDKTASESTKSKSSEKEKTKHSETQEESKNKSALLESQESEASVSDEVSLTLSGGGQVVKSIESISESASKSKISEEHHDTDESDDEFMPKEHSMPSHSELSTTEGKSEMRSEHASSAKEASSIHKEESPSELSYTPATSVTEHSSKNNDLKNSIPVSANDSKAALKSSSTDKDSVSKDKEDSNRARESDLPPSAHEESKEESQKSAHEPTHLVESLHEDDGDNNDDEDHDNNDDKSQNSFKSDDVSLSGKRFAALASSTFRISTGEELRKEIEGLKAENKEQDRLLKGYQKENERLYSELKHAKQQLKTTVNELKSENEHLAFTVAQLREELNTREARRGTSYSPKRKSIGLSTSFDTSPKHQKDLKSLKDVNENLLADLNRVKEQLKSEQQMVELLRSSVEKKNEALKLKSEQLALAEKKNIMLGDRLRSIPKMPMQLSTVTQKKLSKSPKSAGIKVNESDTSSAKANSPAKFKPQSTYTKLGDVTDVMMDTAAHILIEERVQQLQTLLRNNESEMKKNLEDLESKYRSLKKEYTKRLEQQKLQFVKEKAELKSRIDVLENTKLADEHRIAPEPITPRAIKKPLIFHSRGIQVNLLGPMDFTDLLSINRSLQEKIEELQEQIVKLKKENENSEAAAARLAQKALQLTKEMENLRLINEQETKTRCKELDLAHSQMFAELQRESEKKEAEIIKVKKQLLETGEKLKRTLHLQKENDSLQKQVKELDLQLFRALEDQSLETRHFKALNKEISLLESRHLQREKALQNYIKRMHTAHKKALLAEAEKWRLKMTEQYNEIDYFRAQLDSVVEMLEELKRRGVQVPEKTGVY